MIEVREAGPEDEPALAALERKALQRAPVVFLHEHVPGLGAFHALQGDAHAVWVAEEDGVVVGCIADSTRRALFDGTERRVYYLGGLRVSPNASPRTGFALMTRARRRLEDGGHGLGLAVVLSGNAPGLAFVESFTRRRHEVVRAGEVSAIVVPPLPVYRTSGRGLPRAAREDDLPALASLLSSSFSRHYGAPPFSEAWLAETLGRTPGLSIGDFRVVEEGGRLVAAAAFWDQRPVRRLRIAGLDAPNRWKARAWSALARLSGGVGPDTRGGPLAVCYLRFPSAEAGHEAALARLVRAELADARFRRRFATLFAGFHENDPLRSCLDGLVRFSVPSTVLLTIPKSDPALTARTYDPRRPYFVDLSLV